jgi:hypothetical protein
LPSLATSRSRHFLGYVSWFDSTTEGQRKDNERTTEAQPDQVLVVQLKMPYRTIGMVLIDEMIRADCGHRSSCTVLTSSTTTTSDDADDATSDVISSVRSSSGRIARHASRSSSWCSCFLTWWVGPYFDDSCTFSFSGLAAGQALVVRIITMLPRRTSRDD